MIQRSLNVLMMGLLLAGCNVGGGSPGSAERTSTPVAQIQPTLAPSPTP